MEVVAVITMAAVVAIATSVASAAGSSPVGSNRYQDQLNAVSCASTTDCIAVGFYQSAVTFQDLPLAEKWNGESWKLTSAPVSPSSGGGSVFGTFLGVSCPSSASCVAVGWGSGGELAESWNGTRWSIDKLPTVTGPAIPELTAVSCAGVGSCMAVGFYEDSSSSLVDLADELAKGKWTSVSPPPPSGLNGNHRLLSVGCNRTKKSFSCLAGGFFFQGGFPYVQALTWNGLAWSTISTVERHRYVLGSLNGSACITATDCVFAGYAGLSTYTPLAATSNGKTFTIEPTKTPTGTTSAVLFDVACPSTVFCVAVGGYAGSSGKEHTLGEASTKGRWSTVKTPDLGSADPNYLDGVSCANKSSCVAVGYVMTTLRTSTNLGEYWNGKTWRIAPTPNQ